MARIKRNVWLFGFLAIGACYSLFGKELRATILNLLLKSKIKVVNDTSVNSSGRKLLFYKHDTDDLLDFSSTSESTKRIKYVDDPKTTEDTKREITNVSLKEKSIKNLRRSKREARRNKKFSWELSINASKHGDVEIPKNPDVKSFQSKSDEYLDMAVHLKGAGPDKSYEKLHEAWESLGSIMDKLYRDDEDELNKPSVPVLENAESKNIAVNKSLGTTGSKPNSTESLKPFEAIGNREEIVMNSNKSFGIAEKSREPKIFFGLLNFGGNSENPPLDEGSGMVFDDINLKKDNVSTENQSAVAVRDSDLTKIPGISTSSEAFEQEITKKIGVQESILNEPTVITVNESLKDEKNNSIMSTKIENATKVTLNPFDISLGITSTVEAESSLTSEQLKDFCIDLLSKVQKHPKSSDELSNFNESSHPTTTEILITTEVKTVHPEIVTEVTTKSSNRELGFIASLLNRITGGRFRHMSEDVKATSNSVRNLNISSNETASISNEGLIATNEQNNTESENQIIEQDEDILTIANCKTFFQRMQRDAVFSKPNLLDILNNPMLLSQHPSEFNITEIKEETQIRKASFDPTELNAKEVTLFPTSTNNLKDADLLNTKTSEDKTSGELYDQNESMESGMKDKVFKDTTEQNKLPGGNTVSLTIEDSWNGTLDISDIQNLVVEKANLTTLSSKSEFSINKQTISDDRSTEVALDDDRSTEVALEDENIALINKSIESSTDMSRFFGDFLNIGSGERDIQDFDSSTIHGVFKSNRSFLDFLNFGSGERGLDEILSVNKQETTTLHPIEKTKIIGNILGFESDNQIKMEPKTAEENRNKFIDHIHEISALVQPTEESFNKDLGHKNQNKNRLKDINELKITSDHETSTFLEKSSWDGNVDDRRFWNVFNFFGSGDGIELSETSTIQDCKNCSSDSNESLLLNELDHSESENNHTQANIEVPLVFDPVLNETESNTLTDEESFNNETDQISKLQSNFSSKTESSSETESVFKIEDPLKNTTLESLEHPEDCDETHLDLTEPFPLVSSTEVTTASKDQPRFFFDGSGMGSLFGNDNETINLVQETGSSTLTTGKDFEETNQSSEFLQNQSDFSSGSFEMKDSSETEIFKNDPFQNTTLKTLEHSEEDCDENHFDLTELFSLSPSTEVTTMSKDQPRLFFDGSGEGSLFGNDNGPINLVQETELKSTPLSRRRARFDDLPDMPKPVRMDEHIPEEKHRTNFVRSDDSAPNNLDKTELDLRDLSNVPSRSDEEKTEIGRYSTSPITPSGALDKFGPNTFGDGIAAATTPKTLSSSLSSTHPKASVTESTQRFCHSASECNILLNERCISVKGQGICDCGRAFIRHPKTKKCEAPIVLKTSLKLPGEEFHEDLNDKSSDFFQKKRRESIITIMLFLNEDLWRTITDTDVVAFEKGSLIIHWKLTMAAEGNESISDLIQQVDSSLEEALKDEVLVKQVPLNAENALLLSVSNDVDQCEKKELNYCSQGADCIPDEVRGFTCRCKEGYLDNSRNPLYPGEICIEVCPPNFCGENGFCELKADGRRQCLCNGWHIGSRCEISGIVVISSFAALNILIIIVVLFIVCCLRKRRRRRRYYGNNQIMFQPPQEFGQLDQASPRLTAAVALDDLGPTKVSKYMEISTPRFMKPDIRITSPSIVGSSLSYDYDSTFDRTPSAEVKPEPPTYDNVSKV